MRKLLGIAVMTAGALGTAITPPARAVQTWAIAAPMIGLGENYWWVTGVDPGFSSIAAITDPVSKCNPATKPPQPNNTGIGDVLLDVDGTTTHPLTMSYSAPTPSILGGAELVVQFVSAGCKLVGGTFSFSRQGSITVQVPAGARWMLVKNQLQSVITLQV